MWEDGDTRSQSVLHRCLADVEALEGVEARAAAVAGGDVAAADLLEVLQLQMTHAAVTGVAMRVMAAG